MKYRYSLVLLCGLFCTLLTVVRAQEAAPSADTLAARTKKSKQAARLFTQSDPIEFTLTANLRVLLKDRGDKPVTHSAQLAYTDEQGPATLPLTLKVRGNFRRSKVNCSFPPLLIDLPKKKTKNTLFAHQNKVKLVTHCQVDEWVVREYLVYKLYNLLTDYSFRAQLARVTYADSLQKMAPEIHWGFLLEDEDDMAKRNGLKISKLKQINMGYTDSLQMATVAVFEYMIGNTDWSVPFLHNIRLIDNGTGALLPVPYDFDHAGIVAAAYARPAQQLEIASVRERLYRGIAYPMPLLQKVFDSFMKVKPQMYALYQNDSRLDKAYVKRTLKYLDDFFQVINKPASAKAIFGPNDQSNFVIKGLK